MKKTSFSQPAKILNKNLNNLKKKENRQKE